MTLRSVMWLLLVLAVLSGCGDDDGPAAGGGGTGGSGGTSGSGGSAPANDCVTVTTPTGAATFDAVYDEVLCTQSCVDGFCHGGTGSGELRLDRREAAYTALVNQLAIGAECETSGLTRVVPFDADNSLLISKLMPDPPCGTAMPLYAEQENTYIPAAHIDQLRAWINAGALRHPPTELDAGDLDGGDDDAGN